MQGAVQLAAAILASIGVACASTVAVRIDQRKALAGYRTWNFLAQESGSVHAPAADAQALDASLQWLIGRCLLERGFARVTDQPDFTVRYALEVRRQLVSRAETPAASSLSSLHESPSYEVQVTQQRVESYETGHLTILVSDPGDPAVIWRGGFEGRLRGEIDPRLNDAVASVFEHFPASDAISGAQPASGAQARACTRSRMDLLQ